MRTKEIQDSQFVSSAQEQRGEEGNGEHLPECCSTLGQCEGSQIGKTLVRRACNVRLWKKLHEISVKSPRNLGEIYEKSLHLSTQTSEDI